MRWAMAYPCSGPGCNTRKTNMPRVPGSISVLAIGFQGLDYLCLETCVKGIGEQVFCHIPSEAREPYCDEKGWGLILPAAGQSCSDLRFIVAIGTPLPLSG